MKIEEEIHEMKLSILELKLEQKNQGLLISQGNKNTKELNTTLNKLNLTLAEANGKKEGMRTTVKIIWGTVGSSLLGAIVAGSIMLVQMNAQIAVFEKQFELLGKREK